MLKFKDKDITAIYIKTTPVIAVYLRSQKIWPTSILPDVIFSSFYNGYWIDEYPWTDNTPWTD